MSRPKTPPAGVRLPAPQVGDLGPEWGMLPEWERTQNATAAAQYVAAKTGAEFVYVILSGPPGSEASLTIGAWVPTASLLESILEGAFRSVQESQATIVDLRRGREGG